MISDLKTFANCQMEVKAMTNINSNPKDCYTWAMTGPSNSKFFSTWTNFRPRCFASKDLAMRNQG